MTNKIHPHATTIAIAIALLLPAGASAQATKSSYFMATSHARNYLNPALHPENGHVGIPALNNIQAGITTNTLTLDNFIFLQDNNAATPVTFLHKDIPAEKFLAGLAPLNHLSVNASVDLLSLGILHGRSYWNFHAGLRTRATVEIPRSLFELLKVGFTDQEALSTRYDLSGLSASVASYLEVGLGYSRSFLDGRLSVGIRPKLLLGVGDARLTVDALAVDAGTEYWKLESSASLEASAPGIEPKYNAEKKNLDGFNFNWKGIPGTGFAVDAGASFRFLDLGSAGTFTASAAVNDIGVIKWSAKNSYRARTAGTSVTIRPSDYSVHQDGDASSIEDILDDAVDDIKSGMDFFDDPAGQGKTRSTRLDVEFNAGLEYALFNNKLSAGILYSNRVGEHYNTGQCTFSLNGRPLSWFAASATYATAGNSVGLAIHLAPRVGPALFVATDHLLARVTPQGIPINGHNLNIQVGIAFNTGGR
jgi:hypothetical protein